MEKIKWNAVSLPGGGSCRYYCMDALLGRWLNGWRRSSTAIIQECCVQYWTGPGSNTPHSANCTATYHLSRKRCKLDEPRHAGHCWRSKDEIVSDVLLWSPAYGQSKAGLPARTFIQKLCDDTGCNPEDLPKAMNDRETWRERVRDIRASCTSWWWWWWFIMPTYENSVSHQTISWLGIKSTWNLQKNVFCVWRNMF